MSIVEIKTDQGIKKYKYVNEDFETFLVSNLEDGDKIKNGFTYFDYETFEKCNRICRIVKKTDVVRHYREWTSTKSFYKDLPVMYKEKDGKIYVEAFGSPGKYIDEFTYEEYECEDRPHIRTRYYLYTTVDDPNLSLDIKEFHHKEHEINTYGIYPNISKEEYDKAHIEYLVNAMEHSCVENMYKLLKGSYGFSSPNGIYPCDLDLIFEFERVLPEIFKKKSNTPYGEKNLARYLINSIINGYKEQQYFHKYNYDIIMDNNVISTSKEYLYFMCLQYHLKLMKYHKEGIYPYTLLELFFVWENLEKSSEEHINQHVPVTFNGNIVCEDLGDFTSKAMQELVYFKAFDENDTKY
ncbi:hypothetical protein PIROE2DRAFT_16938 [Piromyces sp. E2]|nr:hypothetical protein PIROE2DRAFT_16938 [Piromyces sp. E2]|eukprot:OUM57929.1 hypothetical protein PIROE2DRAFT_16938 [Piromyces sp. E2]